MYVSAEDQEGFIDSVAVERFGIRFAVRLWNVDWSLPHQQTGTVNLTLTPQFKDQEGAWSDFDSAAYWDEAMDDVPYQESAPVAADLNAIVAELDRRGVFAKAVQQIGPATDKEIERLESIAEQAEQAEAALEAAEAAA